MIIHTFKKRAAVLVNNKSGLVELSAPSRHLGSAPTFRSPVFTKFEDGTEFILVFRESDSNSFLVEHTVVPEGTLFDLFFDSATVEKLFDPKTLAAFNTILSGHKLPTISTPRGSESVFFAYGLPPFDAFGLIEEIEEAAQVSPSFAVSQVTEAGEDMSDRWVGTYHVPSELFPVFDVVSSVIEEEDYLNILLTGPTGYGKTSAAQAMAEHFGLKFVRVNCAATQDTESWFGYHEARGGDTVFIPTEFTEAIRGGNAVVLLDEANRIEPWVANSLFPILDYARRTNVHGEDIVVGPGTIFVLTMNLGYQYTGTHSVDLAFKNRVDLFAEINGVSKAQELEIISRSFPEIEGADVLKIVDIATNLRNSNDEVAEMISIRTTLKVAKLVFHGLNVKEAFRLAVVNGVDVELRKVVIDEINMIM